VVGERAAREREDSDGGEDGLECDHCEGVEVEVWWCGSDVSARVGCELERMGGELALFIHERPASRVPAANPVGEEINRSWRQKQGGCERAGGCERGGGCDPEAQRRLNWRCFFLPCNVEPKAESILSNRCRWPAKE
jgi:hypothetical protein